MLDAGFTTAYSAGSLLPVPAEVILRDKITAGAVRGPRLRAASAERDNNPVLARTGIRRRLAGPRRGAGSTSPRTPPRASTA